MYWTIHLDDGPIGDPTPTVAVGCKIYTFAWPKISKSQNKHRPMEVHVLNTENFCWSEILPSAEEEKSGLYPTQRRGHSAVVFEDKIYIWGGVLGEHYFDELLCFDTRLSTWSVPKVSGMLPQTRHSHYAFMVDHSMYIIGGFDKKRTKKYCPDVFSLDLVSMEWKYIAAQSGPYIWEGISACAVGERIYIFGGELYRSHWNGGSYLDTVTGKWHRIVICESCPLMWKSPSFVYENSIYVLGGTYAHGDAVYLLKLSAQTNRWEEVLVPRMSPVPLGFDESVVVNSRLFVFGSRCRYRDPIKDLHIIDFCPNLQLMCLRVIIRHKLDVDTLPKALKLQLMAICT